MSTVDLGLPGRTPAGLLGVPQLPESPSSGNLSSGNLASAEAEAAWKPVSVPDQAVRDRGEP